MKTLDHFEFRREYAELDDKEPRQQVLTTRLFKHKGSNRVIRAACQKNVWSIGHAGRYYLAGPMRGYPLSNFPAFFTAARALQARGLEIVSPAEKDIEAGFDFTQPAEGQNFDLHAAFVWDFRAVLDTNGVILLPGWRTSKGAAAERLVAELCGKEVYLLTEDYRLVEAPKETYDLTWLPLKQALRPIPTTICPPTLNEEP
jgi:hypothetical protein